MTTPTHAATSPLIELRVLQPGAEADIDRVAQGMRRTLVEVEGEAVGIALYTMDWLRDRVRFHLDPALSTAQVFLAVVPAPGDGAERIVGHTIVRVESNEDGRRFGLFSTTYIDPSARRAGIADRLLERGEAWMREHALPEAATWTSATNARLIALYAKRGYAEVEAGPNDQTGTAMVRLAKPLAIDCS